MLDIVFILLISGLVLWATRHGLAQGFPIAVACLVLLPGTLRIALPGDLPYLSIHRIIQLILILRWLQAPRQASSSDGLRLASLLTVALISRGISDALSITPGPSLKDILSFGLESVLYFNLARFALAAPEVRQAALQALIGSLVGVAFIAVAERYTRISLPEVAFSEFKYLSDGIQSTYPHRILLGYAMATGTPLTLYLIDTAKTKGRRRLYWIFLCALIVTCFIADSRGGWLGMGLAGGMSFLLGTRRTRRRCLALLALAVITVLSRPGVRATILSRLFDTFYADSYKAVSYQYRWKLWGVAFAEITRSPERFLFGYGGLSTESMDLSRHFRLLEGGTPDKIGFTSWDNHYASNLIEFGVIGLGIEVLIYGLIVMRLFRCWRRGPPKYPEQGLIGAVLASAIVFMFARTNVYIFGEQPNFLFWSIVAIGASATQPQMTTPAKRGAPMRTARPVAL